MAEQDTGHKTKFSEGRMKTQIGRVHYPKLFAPDTKTEKNI